MKELSESRVLIVDDAEANVDVLVEALRGEYKLSSPSTARRPAQHREEPARPRAPRHRDAGDRRLRGVPAPAGRRATRELPVMFLSSLEDVRDKTRGFEARGERLRDQAVRGPGGQGPRALAAQGQGLLGRGEGGDGAGPAHRPRDPDGDPALGRPRRGCGAPGSTSRRSSSRRSRSAATSTRCCGRPTTGCSWRVGDVSGKGIPAALFMGSP